MSIQSRRGKAEVRANQATFVQDLVRQAEARAAEWERTGGAPRWIQIKQRRRASARW